MWLLVKTMAFHGAAKTNGLFRALHTPKDHELLLQLNKHKTFPIKTSLLQDYVCFKMRAVNLHKTILGNHKLSDNKNEGAENLR